MAKQHTLFDAYDDRIDGKRNGMEAADENADPDWKRAFDLALVAIALERATFTSSHVLSRLADDGVKTHDLRVVGPRMLSAAKQGVIRQTSAHTPSGSHGRPQRIWQSLVFTGGKK